MASLPAFSHPPAEAVRIVEVSPRDGLQNIPHLVPTPIKIELIRRLVRAGLVNVEATSFVSPKWIPQLADNTEVLRAIAPLLRDTSLRLPVLIPNLRGLDGALGSGVKEVAVFVSASESFSRKNTNCSVEQALDRAREVAVKARREGVAVRGYISCIIECPYDGRTPPSAVLRTAHALLEMGCYEVSLGDTLGTATPRDIEALLSVLLDSTSLGIAPSKLAGHFHDTHGQAVANVLQAYEMGLRTFDASVAGLGGCPFAVVNNSSPSCSTSTSTSTSSSTSPSTSPGNVATEDLVRAFHCRGVATGVNLGELIATGRWISDVLGRENEKSVQVDEAKMLKTKHIGQQQMMTAQEIPVVSVR
ncbi:hydroxymethylglutaryl-CoA lyase [Coniella lustricola]|uniref:hydroxymethylglutaryl-CoA lyase n=1 Tax=Coniella lustricola TaxID=2025994 RepID=A0A2T3AE60_9PEZI|nr:hydroxymethylglutaryl-CoA lyase [Coniella lustricola]